MADEQQRPQTPTRYGCPYGHLHCGGDGDCGYERLSEEELAHLNETWWQRMLRICRQ